MSRLDQAAESVPIEAPRTSWSRARIQITLQRSCAIVDSVQKTHSLARNRLPFFGRVAFAEQLDEHLARIEFHR